MTVETNIVRKAVEVKWDTGAVGSEQCTMRAEDAETGGVSTKGPMPNDGYAVLTYPLDFKGETHVTIEGTEGGSDEGTITVGEALPDEKPDEPLEIWGPTDPFPGYGLPGDQPRPDQGLPGSQPRPDQGLPGEQPHPDQGLPGDQPRPDQGLPGGGASTKPVEPAEPKKK
jgi:hypothetical protein